jgi:hypothetical protein
MMRREEWPRVWHHRDHSRPAAHQYDFCLHGNTRHGGSGNLFRFFHSSAEWKEGTRTANDPSGKCTSSRAFYFRLPAPKPPDTGHLDICFRETQRIKTRGQAWGHVMRKIPSEVSSVCSLSLSRGGNSSSFDTSGDFSRVRSGAAGKKRR